MAKRKKLQAGSGDPKPGASATPPAPPELNERQKNFCINYARKPNATVAYHLAYEDANYDSCRAAGATLLTNLSIQQYISMIQEKDRAQINFTRQDALRILTEIALTGKEKTRVVALESLWEKLGLSQESGERNWFDGFGAIADALSRPKGKK